MIEQQIVVLEDWPADLIGFIPRLPRDWQQMTMKQQVEWATRYCYFVKVEEEKSDARREW